MTAVELAARLIPCFEGVRLKAYQDSGGIWTIGIGHTKGVKPGDTCTSDQAIDWLMEDLSLLEKLVEGKGILEATALLDFGFNCGYGNLQKILAGQAKLEDFIHDHKGNILQGLAARRAFEAALIEVVHG